LFIVGTVTDSLASRDLIAGRAFQPMGSLAYLTPHYALLGF